ncbi:MAG: thiamine phosphate synthase [Rhizobiaceae bacterium]
MMVLPRFYPIFDDVSWLKQVLPLGVKLVQLRVKNKPEEELLSQIAESKQLCDEHGAILIVNDHWKLAIALKCDWVHLGQEDLDDADVGAIRAAGIKIGVSTHDHAELERALIIAPDYVALGPIYPTATKKMSWQQQGLEKLTEWRRLIGTIPLIAIGGFTVERSRSAFDAGADVVSVVTDVTLSGNPEARTREWLRAVQ